MKKFFSIVSLVAFAVVVALNMNAGLKSDTESDIMLDNVEALVQGETSGDYYNSTGCSPSWDVVYCTSSACTYTYSTGTCHR
jgi:hypothetical protein